WPGHVPDLPHDPRPVELGGGAADQGVHRPSHPGRRLEERDRGSAGARLWPVDPRSAAEAGLRPAGVAAPDLRAPCRCPCGRLRRLAVDEDPRAGTRARSGRPARPAARAAARRGAPPLRRMIGRIPAGFVVVVFGLAFMGLLPWPERLVAPGLLSGARRSRSNVLLGGAFGVCAAPCIGPVLASTLALASNTSTVAQGSVLLLAYSAGL